MVANRETGARASAWGRDTARQIARVLGATEPAGASNECELNGQPVVIKCAAASTDSVGVTYLMLDRIDAVLGAFELDDGSFEVLWLPAATFRANMTETRSRGASAGRVGIVRKSVFQVRGQRISRVRL